MYRIAEKHLIDWRDALIASKLSPVSVKNGHVAAAKSFFGWARRMKKIASNPAAEFHVDISEKHERRCAGSPTRKRPLSSRRRWRPKFAATYGSARWATLTEIRAAGLTAPDGVVLGKFEPDYLRHDGPEHVHDVCTGRRLVSGVIRHPLGRNPGKSGQRQPSRTNPSLHPVLTIDRQLLHV